MSLSDDRDLFQAIQIDREFDARFEVQSVVIGSHIHDLSDGNSLGENPALAAGHHELARFQKAAPGQIHEVHEQAVETGGAG